MITKCFVYNIYQDGRRKYQRINIATGGCVVCNYRVLHQDLFCDIHARIPFTGLFGMVQKNWTREDIKDALITHSQWKVHIFVHYRCPLFIHCKSCRKQIRTWEDLETEMIKWTFKTESLEPLNYCLKCKPYHFCYRFAAPSRFLITNPNIDPLFYACSTFTQFLNCRYGLFQPLSTIVLRYQPIINAYLIHYRPPLFKGEAFQEIHIDRYGYVFLLKRLIGVSQKCIGLTSHFIGNVFTVIHVPPLKCPQRSFSIRIRPTLYYYVHLKK